MEQNPTLTAQFMAALSKVSESRSLENLKGLAAALGLLNRLWIVDRNKGPISDAANEMIRLFGVPQTPNFWITSEDGLSFLSSDSGHWEVIILDADGNQIRVPSNEEKASAAKACLDAECLLLKEIDAVQDPSRPLPLDVAAKISLLASRCYAATDAAIKMNPTADFDKLLGVIHLSSGQAAHKAIKFLARHLKTF